MLCYAMCLHNIRGQEPAKSMIQMMMQGSAMCVSTYHSHSIYAMCGSILVPRCMFHVQVCAVRFAIC